MANTYVKIGSAQVTNPSGEAYIEFASIPNTYTDLVIMMSIRSAASFVADDLYLTLNGSTSNMQWRRWYSVQVSTQGSDSGTGNIVSAFPGANAPANMFGNLNLYLASYANTSYIKTNFSTAIVENTVQRGDNYMFSAYWNSTSAISTIRLSGAGNLVQHSMATLYGIKNS